MNHKIAFNTANLVARVSGWRFELKNWGDQHTQTVVQTDEKEWSAVCREIAAAGYRAVEIWVAHIDPAGMTDVRAKAYRKILDDNGLTPIALAGTLNDDTARVCRQLNIPACNGGMWGSDLATIRRLTQSTGIHFNYENHPEKSVEEVLARIDGGSDRIGVAVDTGWFGTQGVDAAQAIRQLGKHVTHVHLKDVKHAGGHETCRLGEGVVNIPAVVQTLKEMGYTGWYSWEDEPEDRNPMEIAAEMRQYIENLLERNQ